MIKRYTCEDCSQLYEKTRDDNKYCDTCSVYRLCNAPKPRNEPTKQKTVNVSDVKKWNEQARLQRAKLLEKYSK